MASDDLNAPLGQDKNKGPSWLPRLAPQVLAGLLGLFGLAVAVWGAFVTDPLGGEPVAVISTMPPSPAGPTVIASSGDGRPHARYDGPAGRARRRRGRRSRRRRRRPAARPSPSSTAPAARAMR